jgi:hypothetical protein
MTRERAERIQHSSVTNQTIEEPEPRGHSDTSTRRVDGWTDADKQFVTTDLINMEDGRTD